MGRRHVLRPNFRFLMNNSKIISETRGSFLCRFRRISKFGRFRLISARKWSETCTSATFLIFDEKLRNDEQIAGIISVSISSNLKIRPISARKRSEICTSAKYWFLTKALRVTRAVTKVDSLLHATSLDFGSNRLFMATAPFKLENIEAHITEFDETWHEPQQL